MKVEIINCWQSRYRGERRTRLIPPLTAAHLAGLCPDWVDVSIRHEQVRDVDYDTDADLIALSFMTGYAPHAYRVAERFRRRGKTVVLGGPHATLHPAEASRHGDAVVIGEAEVAWPRLLEDHRRGRMGRVYRAEEPHSLAGLPMPRYDLIERDFILNHYVQATRGCPFTCSFCCLKALEEGLRMRPIDDVVRDIVEYRGRNRLQRKVLWFWDDNLIGHRVYAKELFREMIPLGKWWLTKASVNMADDPELVRLAAESGCAGVFLGVETFSAENLKNVKKHQNKTDKYRQAIKMFHEHGIGVMAGLIVGFDDDTPESIRRIPEIVEDLGIDVPFLNISTPFEGTGLWDEVHGEGRILSSDWSLYNGMSVVFEPVSMSATELADGYLEVWEELVSVRRVLKRITHAPSSLRRLVASIGINGFSAWQGLLGHTPHVRSAVAGRAAAGAPQRVRAERPDRLPVVGEAVY